jgi:hypothetical protein
MNTDCRNDPASEAQKAKLAFFRCTWDDGISYGQACDALDECARRYPDVEAAYLNGPVTEAQRATLLSLGVEFINTKCSSFGQAEQLISDLQTKKFWEEFNPIQKAWEKTLMVTDSDLEAVELLKKKYDVQLTLAGNFVLFRSVFLVEVKRLLPEPIATDLMLNDGERAYYSVRTSWHQVTPRSVSADTRPLADGVLYTTSERLLFSSLAKNAAINLKKIVNCHCYSDFLKVDKSSGKSDLFTMSAAEARYIIALVRALK